MKNDGVMKKTVKANIKSTVEKALTDLVAQLKIANPSRRTRNAISKVAKTLRADIKSAMKKEIKNATSPKARRTKGTAAATV